MYATVGGPVEWTRSGIVGSWMCVRKPDSERRKISTVVGVDQCVVGYASGEDEVSRTD
jgi:hypothetical protein